MSPPTWTTLNRQLVFFSHCCVIIEQNSFSSCALALTAYKLHELLPSRPSSARAHGGFAIKAAARPPKIREAEPGRRPGRFSCPAAPQNARPEPGEARGGDRP